MKHVLKRMQEVQVGVLKGMGHEVFTSISALGRKTLECLIQVQEETVEATARRARTCRHEQRQVGWRPKQVLTRLGSITIQRAYDQSLSREEHQQRDEEPGYTHGEAPAEMRWIIAQSGRERTELSPEV